MQLKNKENGKIYAIESEDASDCIRIYAQARDIGRVNPAAFVMHYRSLKDLNDEWEDIEDD